MSSETSKITRRRLADKREDTTDWARVDALTDEEIEAAVAADPDAPPLLDDDFWANAELVMPAGRKERITLRLDEEILDYFRDLGRGYQTRINAVLRAYVRDQAKEKRTAESCRREP